MVNERWNKILDLLDEKGSLNLKELMEYCNVSEATIRRDLTNLEDKNLLYRTHGGAMKRSAARGSEESVEAKREEYLQEKRAVAKYLCDNVVQSGQTIYLDAGTSTYEMIEHLRDRRITVVTNSTYHLPKLINNKIHTIILGGTLKHSTQAVIGYSAVEQLKKYSFDMCFVGCNGIDESFGVTTAEENEAFIKTTAIQGSKKKYILADKSKFGHRKFQKFAELDDIIIVSYEVPEEYKKFKNIIEVKSTITLNPAVDMLTTAENFALGKLNRTQEAKYVVGGKGINISILLNNVGVDSKAWGFVAGFTGYFIKSELDNLGVKHDFVETSGATRINMKLTTETETEINGQSSSVNLDNVSDFFTKLEVLTEEDVVFLSGNVIAGMGVNDFKAIAKKVSESGATLVVDSNKELVLDTLEYKPFVVKPNEFELGEMFGVTLNSIEEILQYAEKLQDRGAKNVLVSRGADGALLLTENKEVFEVNVAKGKIVSTVAAGDSMLAMFVAKYNETKDYQEALRYASAAGGATSFSVGVGSKQLIEELLPQIEVKKLK